MDETHPVHRRWVLFAHSYLLYARSVERALLPWGLSLPQFLTLFLLRNSSKPVTMSVLANYLGQMNQSATSLAQRMGGRGLIEKVPNPEDRRSSVLRLLPEGEAVLDETWGLVLETVARFFSPLAEEIQVEFEDILRLLRDSAAAELGLDSEKLDFATRSLERDPDMWAQAQAIRESVASRR